MRKVIVIVGPTCSGKTDLSLLIAKHFDTEIISADSRQFYKFLDIGTAKPDKKKLSEIKHHFISFLNPDEYYNASLFENDAIEICNKIINKDRIPVVAGGSGLYVKALVDGIFNSPGADEDIRKDLHEKRNLFGNESIYNELKIVDPESASKMLPQNWKRIIRALEVYYKTGYKISNLQKEYNRNINLNFDMFGLNWDREILYSNIEKRVDEMINKGLIDETEKILNIGFSKKLNSLNTVGYKEIISYLDGEISLDRALELIKRNTRRYAKRQLTWFRADKRIQWMNVKSQEDITNAAEKIFVKGI